MTFYFTYTLTPKKDFHSFRHTLATRLKQADIPESVAGAIVGHTTADGITYGRYGKDYLAEQVKKAIESVDFFDSLEDVTRYVKE
jgi:integrase